MATNHPRLPAANRVRAGTGGFTLIELIISIVLLGILAAVGATMFSDSFTVTSMVNANQASTAQARYALERMEREIREVKFVTGAGFSITPPSATKMVFVRTVDGVDVTVTICNGTAPNCTGGSDLTLGYSTPAATAALTDRVASGGFTLSYCLVDGTTCVSAFDTAVTASTVHFVQISLAVTDSTSGQTISQRTRVALRNASSS